MISKILFPLSFIFSILGLLSCGSSCEDVNVPYVSIEEQETLSTYIIGRREYHRESGWSLLDTPPKIHSETEITNTGKEGGLFKVIKKFETTEDKEITVESEQYIGAGATVNFIIERDLPPYITIKEGSVTTKVYSPTIKEKKEIVKFRHCNSCESDCQSLINEFYKKDIPTEVDSSNWVYYDNSFVGKLKKDIKKL